MKCQKAASNQSRGDEERWNLGGSADAGAGEKLGEVTFRSRAYLTGRRGAVAGTNDDGGPATGTQPELLGRPTIGQSVEQHEYLKERRERAVRRSWRPIAEAG